MPSKWPSKLKCDNLKAGDRSLAGPRTVVRTDRRTAQRTPYYPRRLAPFPTRIRAARFKAVGLLDCTPIIRIASAPLMAISASRHGGAPYF